MTSIDKLLTAKQQTYLFAQDRRINILSGSVRSGKTWISLLKWALFVASMPPECKFLMVGKTLQSLDENCLGLLQDLVGGDFIYKRHAKEGKLYGRHVRLEGADNERAVTKIKGSTLAGVYIDELTEIPETFYYECGRRLSEVGAKLIATTNPDRPNHYVKVNIIDNPNIDVINWHFTIDDNTTLPPEYVENIKKESVGVFYDRYILGLWKAAEGSIYGEYAANPALFTVAVDKIPPLIDVAVGVDFGGSKSATAFVAVGFSAGYGGVYVLDEEHRDAATDNPEKLNAAFVDFCAKVKHKYPMAYRVYCDSAEQYLIKGLRAAIERAGIGVNVQNARKHEIISRIRLVTGLMAQGRFFVNERCTHVKDALSNALWSGKYLTDTRLDNGTTDIDTLDALEYAIERRMGDLGMGYLVKDTGNK